MKPRTVLAALAVVAGPALAQRPALPSLPSLDTIPVRPVIDGPGPSHLLRVGPYLVVVDPWNALVSRYRLADPHAPPRTCAFSRWFAPWRSVGAGARVRLIAEPYGPDARGDGYHYRSRRAMTLTPGALDAMPGEGAPCRFPIRRFGASRPVPAPVRVDPVGPGATVFGLREAGRLSAGRRLVWWSEIDAVGPGDGGRVTASQYVGIVAPGGRRPRHPVRIDTARYPVLAPGGYGGTPTILSKPGFETVVGATVRGQDLLWILAADMDAPSPRAFVLRAYALGRQGAIALAGSGGGTNDREDPVSTSATATGALDATSRAAWFAAATTNLRQQISVRWRFPAGATARPCGGADRCTIAADDAGALGLGPSFTHPVADRLVPAGGAQWMRPRQLVGAAPDAAMRGVPYSIGGEDLADGFVARLVADFGGAGATDPPPVGHIREGLEWPGADGNYPLGIDCSALIAKVYGIGVRSTAGMMRPRRVGGVLVPQGPVHACPEPVRRFADLKPGDIILRDGHVVIYAGPARIGAGRAIRVFESSSRCGAVCESTYDPTFFDGWWMLRLQLGPDGRDCPRWIERPALAALPPRP